MSASQSKTSKDLADKLGVSPQTVSSWKGRESVPYAECVEVAERLSLSLDWLLTGDGAMKRGAIAPTEALSAESHREHVLLELWRELDEAGQREIQSAAEEKKRMSMLEARLRELEAVVADIKRLA